jgi:hypothetical protein
VSAAGLRQARIDVTPAGCPNASRWCNSVSYGRSLTPESGHAAAVLIGAVLIGAVLIGAG